MTVIWNLGRAAICGSTSTKRNILASFRMVSSLCPAKFLWSDLEKPCGPRNSLLGNRKHSWTKIELIYFYIHIFELNIKIFNIKKETKNDILNIHYNEQSKFSTSENNKNLYLINAWIKIFRTNNKILNAEFIF